MTTDTAIVQNPGEAKESLDLFGGVIAIQADGVDTRKAYSLLQMSAPGDDLPRDAFPPPHVHHQDVMPQFRIRPRAHVASRKNPTVLRDGRACAGRLRAGL